jgi:hypothetical protein
VGELSQMLGELAQILGELAQILGELAQILGELAQMVGKLAGRHSGASRARIHHRDTEAQRRTEISLKRKTFSVSLCASVSLW